MILPILTAPRYLLTFNPAFKSGKNRGGEKGEGKNEKGGEMPVLRIQGPALMLARGGDVVGRR